MKVALGFLFALLVSSSASATPIGPDVACTMVCHVETVPYVPSLGLPRPYDEWVIDRWAPETVDVVVCEIVRPIETPVVVAPIVATPEAAVGLLLLIGVVPLAVRRKR